MGYQALYRVWRPQQLKDIVGQEHITKTLQNALISNQFSHAYLFCGPRGTGKTSAAKIVAKAINCEKMPTSEPCNECRACKGITDGSIVDVIEIDAASNNGVDEIRDIRDKVKFMPNEVRYKVYIVDEVHMLSTGAFNALLKTLEEPPKHVIFILATTEPHKIPLTIISRCQRFDFKRITTTSLVERMKTIIAHYDVKVSDEALELLARAADGGMRDALSLLDQAISYGEDEITIDDVLAVTGSVSQQLLTEVVKAIADKNVAKGLEAVDSLIQEGKDPQRFIEDVMFYYRDLLLYQAAPQLVDSLERAKVDDDFKELAATLEKDAIYFAIERLNESHQEMKFVSHGKIFLELAIVKLCDQPVAHDGVSNKEVALLKEQVQKLEAKLNNLSVIPQEVTQASGSEKPKRTTLRSAPVNRALISQINEMLSQATKRDLQTVSSSWGQVLDTIRQKNIRAHAWLMDSKPVASSADTILLAFQNEMHRDMIDTKFRADVDAIIFEIYGRQISFLSVLSGQWEKLKEDFLRQQRGDTPEEKDPIVEEAIKLVGSELIELIE
ncbi:MAG TPA: DNA polymerase III subunit gamma/tau [Bacilli bacterium]|nr:DNA polymerase III subunit gamma/tau [Bacilli bacterium]